MTSLKIDGTKYDKEYYLTAFKKSKGQGKKGLPKTSYTPHPAKSAPGALPKRPVSRHGRGAENLSRKSRGR